MLYGSPVIGLKKRQQIAAFFCEGLSNKEIAERLHISPDTAKLYASHTLKFAGYSDRLKMATAILRDKIRTLEGQVDSLRRAA